MDALLMYSLVYGVGMTLIGQLLKRINRKLLYLPNLVSLFIFIVCILQASQEPSAWVGLAVIILAMVLVFSNVVSLCLNFLLKCYGK